MKQILEDDDKDSVSLLIKRRFPWLFLGLLGGILATILSSRFENVLSENINLAFFIPVIVYMADAVGTQTETVYVRNVADGKLQFGKYLFKETALGIVLGIIFGICIGTFANFGKTKIKILKEMKRVCKSGKKILISVYSDEALDERLKLYRTIRADIKEIKNDGTITFDEKDVVDVISEQFSKKQLILFAKKNRIECDQNQENQKKNRLFVRIHQSGLAMK